jgi:hypothetical protein
MHCTAYTYVGKSVTDPLKCRRNNLCGTGNQLGAICDHKVDKIVFSSTCATYGMPEKRPITEQEPPNPIHPYGRSQLMADAAAAGTAGTAVVGAVCPLPDGKCLRGGARRDGDSGVAVAIAPASQAPDSSGRGHSPEVRCAQRFHSSGCSITTGR